MDCIAATPCAGGNRRSPGMTNDENANSTPPVHPAPTAVTITSAATAVLIAPAP